MQTVRHASSVETIDEDFRWETNDQNIKLMAFGFF